MQSLTEQPLRFGRFTLHRSTRQLLEDARPLRLSDRVFELLVALVERQGEVVNKRDLMHYAWPHADIDEASLRAHVAALRKALGEGEAGQRYIVNVPGRGYCFVASVRRAGAAVAINPDPASRPPNPGLHNLPVQLTRVIGRSNVLQALASQLPRKRFLTIVGPAGMGKTTVALALADQLLASYADGVRLVDLSTIDRPESVPHALADLLDWGAAEGDPLPGLRRHLGGKSMLIVLDSCERVAEAAGELAMSLLMSCPGLHLLATSREPLRVDGESVQRLPPLELPEPAAQMTAHEVMGFPGVQLFVERAIASVDSFVLKDADASHLVELCNRLDGMPLAIELAAARVQAFGVRGLLRALDDRFRLLAGGQRTGQQRHRTLRALMDWSFEALDERDQTVLCRLAVFRGSFSLRAAQDVASDDQVTASQVLECIVSLSLKSLLNAEVGHESVSYRLLETTRYYAFEKLMAGGADFAVHQRLAAHLTEQLNASAVTVSTSTQVRWLALHARPMDDVRSTLDWAFGPQGDLRCGLLLLLAAMPLVPQLSLIPEFHARTEAALRRVATLDPPDQALELRFRLDHHVLSLHFKGPVMAESPVPRFKHLARQAGLESLQAATLNGCWLYDLSSGNYLESLKHAEDLAALARSSEDAGARLIVDRLMAQSQHFCGRHEAARVLAERVLGHPGRVLRLSFQTGVAADRRLSMRIILARVLWLQGHAAQAARILEDAVAIAAEDVPFSTCLVLAWACFPIAFWSGDFRAAQCWADRLASHALKYSLMHWVAFASNAQQLLSWRAERYRDESALSAKLRIDAADHFLRDSFCTFDVACRGAGSFERAKSGLAGWAGAEILRGEGERLQRSLGASAYSQAEALFKDAVRIARDQQALAWELRAAISLAGNLALQGRRAEGIRDLQAVYGRFEEGHETLDMQTARRLLGA